MNLLGSRCWSNSMYFENLERAKTIELSHRQNMESLERFRPGRFARIKKGLVLVR